MGICNRIGKEKQKVLTDDVFQQNMTNKQPTKPLKGFNCCCWFCFVLFCFVILPQPIFFRNTKQEYDSG